MHRIQQILASLLLVAVGTLVTLPSLGQIAVNNNPPNTSAQHLVQNVLLGNGVIANNFSQYGHPTQFGVFQAISVISPIGLDSGIVMSSGEVMDASPFGTPSTGIAGAYGMNPNWGGGDPDITSVASSVNPSINSSFDAAIIEFDFIPTSDTVTFNYVFASEEYLTWINSVYNDAFGFFISGPGITGPYSGGAQNIAVVPNTTTPITISTVQPALNSQYYINNPSSIGTSFNGYTTVLTAIAAVQPCQTYHIKLAISDCSDGILDSGVFLEANSFSAASVSVSATPTFPTINGGDSVTYEGCGDVVLTFERFDGLQDTTIIDINIGGTAQNGIDYQQIPDSLVFLPGQTQIQLNIQSYDDNISEPLESLTISVTDSSCSGVASSGATIYISDPLQIQTQTQDITVSCATGPGTIEVVAGNGVPGYNYTWSNGATTASQVVDPPATTMYYVTVSDTCGLHPVVDSVLVTRIDNPLVIQYEHDTIDCTVDSVEISVQVLSGFAPYQFAWSTGDTDSNIFVSPFQSTAYTVTVSDACGIETEIALIHVEVIERAIGATFEGQLIECPGDLAFVDIVPSGGIAPLTYWWDSGVQNAGQWVSPSQTTLFPAYITDVCGLDTTVVYVEVEVEQFSPLQLSVSSDTVLHCSQDKATLVGNVFEGAGQYKCTWNGWQDTHESDGWTVSRFPAVSTAYTFEATDKCEADTVRATVQVDIADWPPLEVSMPEQFVLCPGEGAELLVTATGGTGVYEYEWKDYPMLQGNRFFVGPEQNEVFRVTVSDECGTEDWGATAVYYLQPTARFDFVVQDNQNVAFSNQSSEDAVNFLWDFGDGSQSQDESPVHPISFDDGDRVVILWVENEFGCRDSASALIEPPVAVYVPNSFTPDGDGRNDFFQVYGIGLQDFEMSIYNRWGELLFQSDNIDNHWDGTSNGRKVPTGTYVYRIKAKGFDQQSVDKVGHVTVVFH